jgi:hypothetical protein
VESFSAKLLFVSRATIENNVSQRNKADKNFGSDSECKNDTSALMARILCAILPTEFNCFIKVFANTVKPMAG